jgi:hypothetical protein
MNGHILKSSFQQKHCNGVPAKLPAENGLNDVCKHTRHWATSFTVYRVLPMPGGRAHHLPAAPSTHENKNYLKTKLNKMTP